MEKLNIIVTDDKIKYRKLLCELLEPFPVSVIGEAGNGQELLALLQKKLPDIVLLDLEMPVMDGNKVFDTIREMYPNLKVIILSFYMEDVLVEHYLERGARGYLSKDAAEPEILFDALTRVYNNGIYINKPLAYKKMYTDRQKEILPLIFEGLTNDEIAEEICISRRAVEKQRTKIYERSGTEKAMDFYKYAFSRGLQFLGRLKVPRQ